MAGGVAHRITSVVPGFENSKTYEGLGVDLIMFAFTSG